MVLAFAVVAATSHGGESDEEGNAFSPAPVSPLRWTLTDAISPAALEAALESRRSSQERYGQATGEAPDDIVSFIDGRTTPELVPFWSAFSALALRAEADPAYATGLEKRLGGYGIAAPDATVIANLVVQQRTLEIAHLETYRSAALEMQGVLDQATRSIGDEAALEAYAASDAATLSGATKAPQSEIDDLFSQIQDNTVEAAAIHNLETLKDSITPAAFEGLRSFLLAEIASDYTLIGGTSGFSIEATNLAYTRSEVNHFDASRWDAEFEARFRLLGTSGLTARWRSGCFLNDSSDGNLIPLDPQTSDFHGGDEFIASAVAGDVMTCPAVIGSFPRCIAGNIATRFQGFATSSVGVMPPSSIQVNHHVQAAGCRRTFELSAAVSGLETGDFVHLRTSVNGGPSTPTQTTTRTITANGTHHLVLVAEGDEFSVDPTGAREGMTCTVPDNTGVMGTTPQVVQVECTRLCEPGSCPDAFPIEVDVSGVVLNEEVVLTNTIRVDGMTLATDTASRSGNGTVTFPTQAPDGARWNITFNGISNPRKMCVLSGATGTVNGQAPEGIGLSCSCTDGGGQFCSEEPEENFPLDFDPPFNEGVCDPRFSLCDGEDEWWDVGTGPPTGGEDCQRQTVCTDVTIYVFPLLGSGSPICTSYLDCFDSCVGGSEPEPSSLALFGPEIDISSPRNGDVVTGTLDITGSIDDADGIAGFVLYLDRVPIEPLALSHSPHTGAFSATLDLSGVANGAHSVTVLAADDYPGYPAASALTVDFAVGTPGNGPDIRVVRQTDSSEVAAGSVDAWGSRDVAQLPVDRTYLLCNVGDASLTLLNHGTMVTGGGFFRIASSGPASSVAAGACSQLRVRLDSDQPGHHTGVIRIESDDPDEAVYEFDIESTAFVEARGAIDIPMAGTTVSGVLTASGWALDDGPLAASSLRFTVDGQPLTLGGLQYGLSRSDACAAHSQLASPNCPFVGWQGSLDTSALADGTHDLVMTITDVDGHETTVTRSFSTANGSASGCQPGAIQAESGSLSGFTVVSDPEACGGAYIEVPNGTANAIGAPNNAYKATFTVDAPRRGVYQLRARQHSPSFSDDSFWVKVDGAPSGGHKWVTQVGQAFETDFVNDWLIEDPVQLLLESGTHTVDVLLREDGTRLDEIELVDVSSSACAGWVREAEDGWLTGFVEIPNSAASGGAHIEVPNGTGNIFAGPSQAYQAVYCFEVTTSGMYRLRTRQHSPTFSDDSFWVRVDGAPTDGYNWVTQVGSGFQPDFVNDWQVQDPVEVFLGAGVHFVTVHLREDGTRLDTIELEVAP